MPVTDDQVATLRALLTGESEEYQRRLAELDREAAKTGWTGLIAAGFFEAVYRRFARRTNRHAEVIKFVGDARARYADVGKDFDPHAAERLILHSLGVEGSIQDLDDNTVIGIQLTVMGMLVADAQLNEAELDEFIQQVRETANEIIGLRESGSA